MIVAAIRSLLLTPTSADIGSRIYPLTLPQGASLPALILQEVNHVQEYSLDHLSRVQVSVLAGGSGSEHGYDLAHRVRDTVRSTLLNYRGIAGSTKIENIVHIGDVEMIEQELDRFLIHSDYYVYWS